MQASPFPTEQTRRDLRRALFQALIAVLGVLLIGAAALYRVEQARQHAYRQDVSMLATSYATQAGVQAGVQAEQVFALANTLETELERNGGKVQDMVWLGRELLRQRAPAVNVLVAPDDKLSLYIDSEKTLRRPELPLIDMREDPRYEGRVRNFLSPHQVAIVGPLESRVDGRMVIIGLLPVFSPGKGGDREQEAEFERWGVVGVSFEVSRLMDSSHLARLGNRFRFELSRTRADTGTKAVIAASAVPLGPDPVLAGVTVQNETWVLAVTPIGGWAMSEGLRADIILLAMLAILVGGMVFAFLRQPARLRQQLALGTAELERQRQALENEVALRRQVQAHLRAVAETVGTRADDAYLLDLLDKFRGYAGADGVVLGELLPDQPDRLTLTFLNRSGHPEYLCYPLAGSPCGDLLKQGRLIIPDKVTALYPDVAPIQERGAQGWAGQELLGRNGAQLGVIVFTWQEALADTAAIEMLLPVFASRAASELERRNSERVLASSEQRYSQLIEDVQAVVWEFDRQERRLRFVSPQIVSVLGFEVADWLRPEFFLSRLHPGDVAAVEAMLTAASPAGGDGLECRVVSFDGRVVWFRMVRGPSRLDCPSTHVAGVMFDISVQKRNEQAMSRVAEALSTKIGTDYFDTLTRELAEVLLADYVVISELAPAGDRAEILGVWAPPGVYPGRGYALAGTPCGALLEGGPSHYVEGLAELFPQSNLVREMGIQSYVGVRLVDSFGEVIGLIAALWRAPLKEVSRAETTMRLFATQAVAELERKKIVDDLCREKETARRYLDVIGNILVVLDPNGVVRLINRRGCELLGCDEDEVIGRNWFDAFVPEDERQEVRQASREWQQREDGCIACSLSPVLTRDGRRRMLSWQDMLVRREDGSIEAVYSSGEDITDRLSAEAAVKREQERFLQVFLAMPDPMLIVQLPSFQMIAANRALADLSGFDLAELHGKVTQDFARWCDVGRRAEMTRLLLARRNVRNFKADFVDKAGSVKKMLLSVEHIGLAEGECAVVLVRDVTELRQADDERHALEIRLQQAQKMESIGLLAGGIAHDFNNLLATMLGYAELARTRFAPKQAELTPYLDEILTAGNRGRDLVQQLLAFSRGSETNAGSLQIAPIIEEVVRLLRSTLPTSVGIECELDVALPMVRLGQVQLHQILMNLGINARDAMGGRGRLRIRAYAASLDGEHVCASCRQGFGGEMVVVEVGDDGCGIDAETRRRMFEPFFTTKPMGQGTGLGLAVTHGILHGHGGHLELDSAPGHGSVFRLYLPALAGTEAVPSRVVPAGATFQGPLSASVLVVDDEPGVARYLAELFGQHECLVEVHTDPAAALEAFRAKPHRYDLIVTDQTMPGLSGVELAGLLRQVRPDIPVILCTGYSADLDESRATALGIDRYLEKPVAAEVLLNAAAEVLG